MGDWRHSQVVQMYGRIYLVVLKIFTLTEIPVPLPQKFGSRRRKRTRR